LPVPMIVVLLGVGARINHRDLMPVEPTVML
jgi:hypothetical protein